MKAKRGRKLTPDLRDNLSGFFFGEVTAMSSRLTPVPTTLPRPRVTPTNDVAVRKSSSEPSKAAPKAKQSAMTTIYQDDFCQIVTDDKKMTKAQGQQLAKKIEDAYEYDTKTEAWKNTGALKQDVLEVDALTKQGYDKLLGGDSTGVAGVTMGPNLMAVPENLAQSTNPDDDDTIAHELNHVQDFREAGDGIDKIPVYEQEGKAYTMGDSYPIALGTANKDPVLGEVGNFLTTVTGAQAREIMNNYRDGSAESDPSRNGFRDETTGALYVQFLKTQFQGGNPDAVQKLAQVTSDVGTGMSYDAAFQKSFGASSKSSEDAFVKFVTDTEKDPAARLKGTIWEPYVNAK